jgi:signal transduction histidine kinase
VYPPLLRDRGLIDALKAAARLTSSDVSVRAAAIGRYPQAVEAAVYFCCLEALQNAIKHAGERASASIELDGRGGLSFDVRDTGRGCDASALQHGHGFANLQDRLSAVGGVLAVDATPGQGVRILGRIPEELLADGEPTSPLPTITAFQMSPGRRARPNTVSIIRLPEARSPRGGGPLRDLRKGGHPDADATPDA